MDKLYKEKYGSFEGTLFGDPEYEKIIQSAKEDPVIALATLLSFDCGHLSYRQNSSNSSLNDAGSFDITEKFRIELSDTHPKLTEKEILTLRAYRALNYCEFNIMKELEECGIELNPYLLSVKCSKNLSEELEQKELDFEVIQNLVKYLDKLSPHLLFGKLSKRLSEELKKEKPDFKVIRSLLKYEATLDSHLFIERLSEELEKENPDFDITEGLWEFHATIDYDCVKKTLLKALNSHFHTHIQQYRAVKKDFLNRLLKYGAEPNEEYIVEKCLEDLRASSFSNATILYGYLKEQPYIDTVKEQANKLSFKYREKDDAETATKLIQSFGLRVPRHQKEPIFYGLNYSQ